MKSLIILVAMLANLALPTRATESAYEKAMAKEIGLLNQARTVEDLQKSANTFTRIAESNSQEWLPQYYGALAYAHMGFRSQGSLQEKDALYSQAKKLAAKAGELAPNNSEVVALQGYIMMGELSADPGSRGASMSGLVMQTFGKAVGMDQTNPRALALMAQMEAGTAKFFGQGPEKACGMAKASLELFAKEAASENSGLMPRWGKPMAEQLLASCGE